MYRSGSDTGFYDKCSAVRALRVYLRPRFSLHRTENDNITLRPLKCRYHSDMEFSVFQKRFAKTGEFRPSKAGPCLKRVDHLPQCRACAPLKQKKKKKRNDKVKGKLPCILYLDVYVLTYVYSTW